MFALDEAGAWTTIVLIVADAALKGVAVLAVAALATVLLRRASAAARHLVWFTAVVGVLMLPVLSAWLPGWQVLPRVVDLAAVPTVETVPAEIPIPAVIEVLDLTPVSVPLATDRIEMPMPTEATPSEPIAQVPEHVPAAPAAVVEHRGRVSIWTGLLLVWALGAAVALLPVSLGVLSLWWLTRTSRPIVEDPWSALLGELTAVLGLRRRPLLLQSPRRSVPMTFGALAGIIPASMPGGRAKVLIPEDASDWSAQRCRAVLLHELAHIKRFDCLTQLITQLACAVHWFNPLIWLASRRMLAERERACDDLVLAEGTKSSDYAEHILQIVASQPARPFAAFAGIRFARRSKLEGRLVAILDKNRNRRALTRLTVAATIVLLTAIVVPVAMLRSAELRNPVQIDSNGNFVVTHVLYIHGQPNAPLFVLEDASYHDIDEVVAHIKRLMKHEPFPYIRVRASRAHRVNQSLIDDLGKRCRAIGFINMEYRYDLLGATSMPAELRFLSYEHQRKVSPEGPWFTAIQTYWLPNGERRDTTEDRRLLGAFHELGDPDARPPDGLSWLYMWFAGPPGEGLLSGSAKLLGAKERVIASSGDNRNEIPRPELEHRPWLMFRFALPTDRIPPVANVELEYAAADKSGRPIRPLHRVLYRNISLKPGHRTDVRVAPSGPAKGLAASIRPRNGNDREVAQLAIDLIAAVRVGDRQRCDELLGGGGGLALELTGYSRSHDLTQLKLHAVYAGGKALLITTQPLSSKVGEPIVLRILLLRESGQWHGRIVESGATGSHGDYVKRLRGQYPDLKAIKVDPELVPRAAPAPAPTVTFAYDHFIGTYADARQPDRSWFKITRKGDTYVAHSIGGPSHEMEMASDGLTFTDPAERFTFRYDTSTNRYELRLHSKSDPQPKTVGVFDLVKVTGKNSQPESPPRGKGFSPVTEHTLSTPTVDRRNAFVDLDRGRIVVPPHELDLTDRQAVWE